MTDWDSDILWGDDEDFDSIAGKIVGQTHQAYKMMGEDLQVFWVPKSVSEEDGTGGLVVKTWFIEKEGLAQ